MVQWHSKLTMTTGPSASKDNYVHHAMCSCMRGAPALVQVASAEAPYVPSPTASPRRSPRRSTRRGSGLALEPGPRGPPWGDQVALGPLLGRGSAGKVFRGLRGGRPVAVKVHGCCLTPLDICPCTYAVSCQCGVTCASCERREAIKVEGKSEDWKPAQGVNDRNLQALRC